MTNVTYASRGIKRKPVFEYESKSLLDTIVVEFEDLPESEIYQSEFDLNAAINAGSNGLDEEGSDEYEDSEEESQAPLRKLPKLEKPLKRRKRQNSVPTRVSKYTEVDEEDEYDEAETFLRKRKRSSASRNAPSKGLDLSLVEFVCWLVLTNNCLISKVLIFAIPGRGCVQKNIGPEGRDN